MYQMSHWKRALPLVITGLFLIGLVGCVDKKPLTKEHMAYAGTWVAQDGASRVVIYADGGADCKTSGTKITGGAVKIDTTALVIKLGPIQCSFQINTPPKSAGGKRTMTLNQVVYTRQ